MKRWYVRLRPEPNEYGRWIPTGCADFAAAYTYITTFYHDSIVAEWLQL